MRRTVLLAVVVAVLGGCSSGHDDLAADGTTTTTTTTTSTHSGSGGEGTGGFGASGGGASTGGAGGAEPAGPTELTFVNGIVDADAIRLCPLGYPNGENGEAAPWPASPAGLAYAAGRSIGDPSALVPTGVDVRLWVVGGDLAAAAGKTCAEIVAEGQAGGGGGGGGGGGPGFVVAALPVLPAAVWESGKSLLLVAAGCIGGPGHSDQADKLVCGSAYGPTTPTATLVAVGMSRKTDPSHVSLQAVHASVAATDLDLKVTPGFDNSLEKAFAMGLSFGALEPKPPYDALSADDYGPAAKVGFKTYAPNDTVPTSATVLGDLFGAGEVSEADFADGAGFTVVAVGPYPGLGAGSFWQPFTLVLVRADP